MPARVLFAFLIAAGAGVAAGRVVGEARQAGSATPTFRAAVDIVSLNVTVTRSEQRYVSDLSAGDFTVLEDGVPQPLRFFARSGVPISMALLIDTSASMADTLPIAHEAAIGFVRQLDEGDLVSIVEFETRVEVTQPLVGDVGALERAIRGIQAGGTTSF